MRVSPFLPQLGLTCTLLILFTATSSSATPTFFTDGASFQTAVAGAGISVTVESFEGLANLTPAPFTIGNVTVSPVGSTLVTIFSPSTQATDGTTVVGWNTGGSPAQVTFTFGTPINAFGIDIIDLGDFTPPGGSGPAPASLELTIASGSQLLFSNVTGLDGNVRFGGVIDAANAFTTATFTFTGDELVLLC